MDKNSLIVLGFLLLCILLSLDKKEGLVVVREDLFETQLCGDNHSDCGVFLSGQSGVECADPPDRGNYIISPEKMPFTGSLSDGLSTSFDMIPTGCAPGSIATGEPFDSHSCSSEGGEYTLTGCTAVCSKPQSDAVYNIGTSAPDGINPQEVISAETGITCGDGYTKATNTCFNKITGERTHDGRSACRADANLEWFGSNDPIKVYCETGGGTYKVMGCEPECAHRNNISASISEYIITSSDSITSGYTDNKELIQTMDNRSINDQVLTEPVTLTQFPYTENGGSILASNDTFNVVLTPADNWTFRESESSTEPCNISEDNNKYYVNGLYPACDPSSEECLNFNIVYNEGESVPENLQELRNSLPVENIFPEDSEIPDASTDEGLAELNKYKNALYYFRRFKNSDNKDEIEAQIRCDIDEGSDFHCSFTRRPRIKYVLGGLIGRSCANECSLAQELWADDTGIPSNVPMGSSGRATCVDWQPDDYELTEQGMREIMGSPDTINHFRIRYTNIDDNPGVPANIPYSGASYDPANPIGEEYISGGCSEYLNNYWGPGRLVPQNGGVSNSPGTALANVGTAPWDAPTDLGGSSPWRRENSQMAADNICFYRNESEPLYLDRGRSETVQYQVGDWPIPDSEHTRALTCEHGDTAAVRGFQKLCKCQY